MLKRCIFLLLMTPSLARAGTVMGNGGATEITQIANNLQLIKEGVELANQTITLYQQLRRQNEMVKDMDRQGRGLSSHRWGDTSADLMALSNVVRMGEALAYSGANIDVAFRQKYRGYDAYYRERAIGSDTYSDRYSDWSKTNMDTIIASMRAAQLQEKQFATEEELMTTLQLMGETAEGRMQAIQIGNQIAAQQVRQTQKLRALVMAQMQMQASYMANQANEKDADQARSEKYFREDGSAINVHSGQRF